MKNTERFTDRVENYVRYRPHYPHEIIPYLKQQIGLNSEWIVADIGSGTGISSQLFLKNGNLVYAVEPNQAMRMAAEDLYRNEKRFISIIGTAEHTTLPDQSIDLILAGQAFHWFDKGASKKEFLRMARPGAYLALIWNERDFENQFQKAYEQMLLDYAPAYQEVCDTIDETTIRDFYSPRPYSLQIFPHAQSFDLEGLIGRLLSSSYAPLEHDPNYQPMMRRLAQIFAQYSVNGRVEFAYLCKLFHGKF